MTERTFGWWDGWVVIVNEQMVFAHRSFMTCSHMNREAQERYSGTVSDYHTTHLEEILKRNMHTLTFQNPSFCYS